MHKPEDLQGLKAQMKKEPFYFRFPGGESGADVYDRLSAFMDSLYRQWLLPSRAENYVLITHDTICKLFLLRWFKWDSRVMSSLPRFPGGGVAVMEQGDDGRYVIKSHPFTAEQIAKLPPEARTVFLAQTPSSNTPNELEV